MSEETDEEYEKRCEDHRKRKEIEKVKAEARRKVMETLTPEQRGALGIR
jgi:adenosyl cobinamide kinase/adenosyl cobinamide phosphate guanylyltransferase